MNLNADFTKRAVVHAATLDWKASPMPGVERRMLDRIGDEVARATSIVRYAPGSHFSPHVHDGGEEFLVLRGRVSGRARRFSRRILCPQPATVPSHARLEAGLHNVREALAVRPCRPQACAARYQQDGAARRQGSRWREAAAALQRRPRGRSPRAVDPNGGLEVLVLEGGFHEGGETYGAQSWLRLPMGTHFSRRARAATDGCRVWIKEGHLRHVQAARPTGEGGE